MADFKFDIKQNLGVISESTKGWKREVNVMTWNKKKPKVDIREWDENHEKMGKGITLNKEELKELKEILNGIDIDELDIE
ncbi:YdbC family protein [Clostridium peptidivorans]|uniref:YdbC family protein n=1 Tax=Clostridium peptidivorans TaxID=100174 RepID=UPI000BE279F7|nr:PC4/YdbC family ssDNA-binding protein [Clostridium peptidivorans]